MVWAVVFHEEFDPEFELLAAEVQDELLAHARLLAQFGPTLGRPRVDTLEGSHHANLSSASMPRAASGGWLSSSTGHGAPCFSSLATRRAKARAGSAGR